MLCRSNDRFGFITQNTFYERIDQMIQGKRHLADMTVATGENWIGKPSNKTDLLPLGIKKQMCAREVPLLNLEKLKCACAYLLLGHIKRNISLKVPHLVAGDAEVGD